MKTYHCWCHVCDKRYSEEMQFASGQYRIENGEDLLVKAHQDHDNELKQKSWKWYSKTGLPYSVAKI